MIYPTIDDVSSKYGAPMGRRSQMGEVRGFVKLFRVPISAGGSDPGGAYWGSPSDLWCATDENDFRVFVRAKTPKEAREMIVDMAAIPDHVLVHDYITNFVTGFFAALIDDAYAVANDCGGREDADESEELISALIDASATDFDDESQDYIFNLACEFTKQLTRQDLLPQGFCDWEKLGFYTYHTEVGSGIGIWEHENIFGENARAISDLIRRGDYSVFLNEDTGELGVESC